jgi:hypothetical protein
VNNRALKPIIADELIDRAEDRLIGLIDSQWPEAEEQWPHHLVRQRP